MTSGQQAYASHNAKNTTNLPEALSVSRSEILIRHWEKLQAVRRRINALHHKERNQCSNGDFNASCSHVHKKLAETIHPCLILVYKYFKINHPNPGGSVITSLCSEQRRVGAYVYNVRRITCASAFGECSKEPRAVAELCIRELSDDGLVVVKSTVVSNDTTAAASQGSRYWWCGICVVRARGTARSLSGRPYHVCFAHPQNKPPPGYGHIVGRWETKCSGISNLNYYHPLPPANSHPLPAMLVERASLSGGTGNYVHSAPRAGNESPMSAGRHASHCCRRTDDCQYCGVVISDRTCNYGS
ncbi:hypothetical protein CBL_05513 [Carabus blaptoides fortunei]